ncbi:MAG: cobalamin-independent methionine synthase II family protein [Candidatus Binatia bacterium]
MAGALMLRSQRRFLTTHAGSLPRPKALVEMFARLSRREPVDAGELGEAIEQSRRTTVERQIEAGIDVGNDGEQARESFFTYVQHRMSGFGGKSNRPVMKDIIAYPSFAELKFRDLAKTMVNLLAAPKATGEVRHVDRAPIEKECADFRRILGEVGAGFAEPFLTAASPGIIASAMINEHYPSYRDYVMAVADALRIEYEHIVSQGFVLQIDCPDLAMERHTSFADRPLGEFLEYVDLNVSAINHALANVAPERVRMHVCWGNYEGPHDCDVPLDDILPNLYAAKVGGLVLAMANPRHEHEYRSLKRAPLPADWLLVAGVIDTTTNYVEHPEVVCDRIERAVAAVGDPHRVLAGTDCGFDTAAGLGEVAEEVVWLKLRALRAGADLAARRLL